MIFLGEWGDRSQLATVALSATGPPFYVFIGAFLVNPSMFF
jgi:putative Ca2+/H+ antiporter (TMEM165/GDT1 family)